jgi:hypothetical protein
MTPASLCSARIGPTGASFSKLTSMSGMTDKRSHGYQVEYKIKDNESPEGAIIL